MNIAGRMRKARQANDVQAEKEKPVKKTKKKTAKKKVKK